MIAVPKLNNYQSTNQSQLAQVLYQPNAVQVLSILYVEKSSLRHRFNETHHILALPQTHNHPTHTHHHHHSNTKVPNHIQRPLLLVIAFKIVGCLLDELGLHEQQYLHENSAYVYYLQVGRVKLSVLEEQLRERYAQYLFQDDVAISLKGYPKAIAQDVLLNQLALHVLQERHVVQIVIFAKITKKHVLDLFPEFNKEVRQSIVFEIDVELHDSWMLNSCGGWIDVVCYSIMEDYEYIVDDFGLGTLDLQQKVIYIDEVLALFLYESTVLRDNHYKQNHQQVNQPSFFHMHHQPLTYQLLLLSQCILPIYYFIILLPLRWPVFQYREFLSPVFDVLQEGFQLLRGDSRGELIDVGVVEGELCEEVESGGQEQDNDGYGQ